MKDTFIMNAEYLSTKDKKIADLLDGLSNDERELDRNSYYKSLSGLFRHVAGGAAFFLSSLKENLPDDSAAKKVASPDAKTIPQGVLTEAQWKSVKELLFQADKAILEFTFALKEEELQLPAKWFAGGTVPLYFMLHNLLVHQVHHHGQISQVLDEMKIDNDFCGLGTEFLPPGVYKK